MNERKKKKKLFLLALGGCQLLSEWLHNSVGATQPGENTKFYIQIS
jgi:hypothetical protein